MDVAVRDMANILARSTEHVTVLRCLAKLMAGVGLADWTGWLRRFFWRVQDADGDAVWQESHFAVRVGIALVRT